MIRTLSFAVALVTVATGLAEIIAAQDDAWRQGRATFYGNEPWLWSIHEGSCGYGYIYADEPLGWNVVALADSHPDFAGSCGRCYEVKCQPGTFTDGYGQTLTRKDSCYDPEASLVVRTTDACACNYPSNELSNKRWCCGDIDHLDLSVWSFERLADTKWGVIQLDYREVGCGYQPVKEAPQVANPFPGEDPPSGSTRTDRWGTSKNVDTQDTYEPRDESETTTEVSKKWGNASWSADVKSAGNAPEGVQAECAEVQPGGALAYQGKQGDFDGKLVLDMWVDTWDGVPDVDVYISGSGTTCSRVRLQELAQSGEEGSWTKYAVYLGLFNGQDNNIVTAFAEQFTGCGGMDAKQLDKLELRNDKNWQQRVCVAGAKLVE